MKTYFFLLAAVLLSPAFNSQSTWSLGLSSVVEKDGRGLGGASIELLQGSNVVKKTVTAANGYFSVDVPGNGEYLLKVSYQDCNSKTFLIKTTGVPPDVVERDNNRPTMKIDGVTMKKPLYSINYSALKMPMAKILYVPDDKKFGHDETHTGKMLDALDAIREAENALLEKHANAIKDGDAALKKKDCPLAKKNYETAIKLIPEAPYDEEPKLKLSQADKCLQEKDAAAAAKGVQEQEAIKKAEADRLAKEQAAMQKTQAEKLASEKAAKDKENADNAAKQKAEAEKLAKERSDAEKTNKEKVSKEKEQADKLAAAEAARAKEEVDKASRQKADTEKAEKQKQEAERLSREKAAKTESDKLAKQRSEQEAKDRSKKEQEEKLVREQQEKAKAESDKAAKEKLARDKAAKADTKSTNLNSATTTPKPDKQKTTQATKEKSATGGGEILVNEEVIQKEQARVSQKESVMKGGQAAGDPGDKGERKKREGKSQNIPKVLGAQDNYREAVKAGDGYFTMKRWEEARKSYQEALIYKKEDPYATRKISEIEKILK